ncbi:MAG: hypothetical protein HY234_00560 [Acidobacteria bacterium]|nr:hypothetical protein [Acidobacteriota bacterium]MBI3661533.1 hypothetical protein [Acidobacteriota bacterium]
MATISTLRPNVTRAEALEEFHRGLSGFLRRARWGVLRSIAEAYVPFRLYRVEIVSGAVPQVSWFALDAVSGSLDLYQFDHRPEETELVRVETRNRPSSTLDDALAVRLLEDKIQRLIFQTGFFRVRHLQIRAELIPLDLHVPYWIGFYGRDETPRLHVMDAVRRRCEGAKARAFFERWLAG